MGQYHQAGGNRSELTADDREWRRAHCHVAERGTRALSRWQSSPPNSDRFASWRCSISNDLAGSGRAQKWLTSANVTMPSRPHPEARGPGPCLGGARSRRRPQARRLRPANQMSPNPPLDQHSICPKCSDDEQSEINREATRAEECRVTQGISHRSYVSYIDKSREYYSASTTPGCPAGSTGRATR